MRLAMLVAMFGRLGEGHGARQGEAEGEGKSKGPTIGH
jgi:hypothetical protein